MTENKYFTTGEVAKILGVKIHQIAYAIAVGHIQGASHEFMNKKMWTREDIDRLGKYFANKTKEKEKGDDRNEI